MCGSAVGTGGCPADSDPDGAAAGDPAGDDESAAADELIVGEFAADDEVVGALGSELAAAVGLATCGDVDVHALKQRTASTMAQRRGAITKVGCRTPRRIQSASRTRWPSGTHSAYPFRPPSR